VTVRVADVTEWIAKTNKDREADPPKPEESMEDTGLVRRDFAGCTEFGQDEDWCRPRQNPLQPEFKHNVV
jgi:hypothetical protein